MDIQLGSKVRDTITGFVGIVISKHIYLNGCVRLSVAPPVDKEGKLQESQAFDIQQLEVIEGPVQVAAPESAAPRPGGDRPMTVPHR